MKRLTLFLPCCMAAALCLISTPIRAASVTVNVRVENLGPAGGVGITPVWTGFHNGNFDTYNSGAAAGHVTPGLEQLAELGSTGTLSTDFLGGFTYVNSGGQNARVASTGGTAGRVSGGVGGAPILPGQVANMDFTLDDGGANNFFSYASMVIPSSDYFIANGDPTMFNIASVLSGGGPVTFNIGTLGSVNDAGSELNSFATSAGNPLFGVEAGNAMAGAPETAGNGHVRSVTNPFATFLPPASGTAPSAATLAAFNFNNAALYPNGIARITITAVPEPSGLALAAIGAVGFVFRRRRS